MLVLLYLAQERVNSDIEIMIFEAKLIFCNLFMFYLYLTCIWS